MADVKLLTGDLLEVLRNVGNSSPTDSDLIRLDVFFTEGMSNRVRAVECFSTGGYVRWFVDANLRCSVAADLAMEAILAKNHDIGNAQVQYRRLSQSRVQACVTIGSLDWVWESRSLVAPHDWRLHRMALNDPDDEEYYWRPWVSSMETAEEDYNEYIQQRSRDDIALDMSSDDTDSQASSVGSWLAEVSDSGARDFSSYLNISKKMKSLSAPRFAQVDPGANAGGEDDEDDAYWSRYGAEDAVNYDAAAWQLEAEADDFEDYWCM